MDQDVIAPSTDEITIPSPETLVGGSSSAPPELNIFNDKGKLPESEFVDVVHLQSRVFQLEQESSSKDLIIGNRDVRVGELEKHNQEKNAKILDLQANLGGITAVMYDLKKRLAHMFDD
ncbi:hypothetical protein LXL04_034192 [Taraxacum kok-saghyz]